MEGKQANAVLCGRIEQRKSERARPMVPILLFFHKRGWDVEMQCVSPAGWWAKRVGLTGTWNTTFFAPASGR